MFPIPKPWACAALTTSILPARLYTRIWTVSDLCSFTFKSTSGFTLMSSKKVEHEVWVLFHLVEAKSSTLNLITHVFMEHTSCTCWNTFRLLSSSEEKASCCSVQRHSTQMRFSKFLATVYGRTTCNYDARVSTCFSPWSVDLIGLYLVTNKMFLTIFMIFSPAKTVWQTVHLS